MVDASSSQPQVNAVEVLLAQNADMEQEIQRLNRQLDETTNGIHMRGYLHKYRDREISFASKWGLRYFVLQGQSLSYFSDDQEKRPRRTIDLAGCIVRDDGTKKNGHHFVFSIITMDFYDDDSDLDNGTESSGNVLLRLSTTSKADAIQWIKVLGLACSENHETAVVNDAPVITQKSWPSVNNFLQENLKDSNSKKLGDNSQILQRVKSSSEILQKSLSRMSLLGMDSNHSKTPPPLSTPSSLSPLAEGDQSPLSPPSTTTATTADGNKTSTTVSLEPPRKKNIVTFPACKPMHTQSVTSPLSSDVRPGEQNYRGFFNLGVIILALSNVQIIVDNLQHYGVVVSLPQISYADMVAILIYMSKVFVTYSLSVLLCYGIEILRYRRLISERFCVTLHVLFGICNIVGPIVWVWISKTHPLLCMFYLFEASILWMKLISYAHVNRDLRSISYMQKKLRSGSKNNSRSNSPMRGPSSSISPMKAFSSSDTLTNRFNKEPIATTNSNSSSLNDSTRRGFSLNNSGRHYDVNAKPFYEDVKDLEPPFLYFPANLTLPNLLYFCVAPTLCYQLNYPRSPRIRRSYVITYVVRIIIIGAFMVVAIQQYIFPTLHNSLGFVKNKDIIGVAQVVLALSVPNSYAWVLMFYLFFHLWLNLLAELCRFGDRSFYKDWWNSRNISVYWKNWNLPVHHWMLRHLYHPLVSAGVKKWMATIIVFGFSALFHEIILSVPFRCLTMYAFVGMLMQAPLITITNYIDKRFDNSFLGNVIFWCLFCVIGQPMGIVMVYYDHWNFSK